MKKYFLLLLTFLLFTSPIYAQRTIKTEQITIGAGDKDGGLYPIAVSVAKVLQINTRSHKLNPDVIITAGAVQNIDNVISGELTFGVVENDIQYRAYKGLGEWDGDPQYDLRSIISLAPEVMQLIVNEKSKIKTLLDLEGKNINLGLIGDTTYHNAQLILESFGFDNNSITYLDSNSLAETIIMLQDGRIDGFFLTSITPLAIISQATQTSQIRFIDITGARKLLLHYPNYKLTNISRQTYPNSKNPNDTKTISVMTSIVTSSNTSNYMAYIMAKEIVENLNTLKALHPALKNLNLKEMLKYNTAPIHPGAMRYYMDNKLM